MSSLFAILMAIGCSSPPTGPQTPTESAPPAQVTDPGQVTDLIVTDSSGTAVTLSFTQVDDGSGNPAEYAVRSHVGPMNWGAADEVTQGTCAAPLQGTAIGSTMSCTIEGLLPDVAYTYQVAAFRGTFQTDAVYGELSNVVPDMEDEADVPSDPEPGTTTIVDEAWITNSPAGWYLGGSPPVVSVLGSDDVLQMRYAEGFEGGVGPANVAYNWETNLGKLSDDITIEMRWAANAGWQNHKSNVNKIAFVFLKNVAQFVPVFYKDHIRIAPEKPGGWNWLMPNVNFEAAKPTLGEWTDLKFKFTKTAPSTWTVKFWVNGTLVGDHQDVPMPVEDESLQRLALNPTWGGTGDVKTDTDYFWYDHVRVTAGDM